MKKTGIVAANMAAGEGPYLQDILQGVLYPPLHTLLSLVRPFSLRIMSSRSKFGAGQVLDVSSNANKTMFKMSLGDKLLPLD